MALRAACSGIKIQDYTHTLVDCSEGGQKWRLRPSSASFLDSVGRSRLRSPFPSPSPLILIFLILRHPSYSFLEWRGRGATGRLGRRFGCGGAATTPGTALGPGGCHPRGRPGLSRAPARTSQHLNTPSTGPKDAGVSGIPEGTVGGVRGPGKVWWTGASPLLQG